MKASINLLFRTIKKQEDELELKRFSFFRKHHQQYLIFLISLGPRIRYRSLYLFNTLRNMLDSWKKHFDLLVFDPLLKTFIESITRIC